MTSTRAVSTTVVGFLVSQILAIAVHGFVLAGDYEPFEGLSGGARYSAAAKPPELMYPAVSALSHTRP